MRNDHSRASGSIAAASGLPIPEGELPDGATGDALSDVLRTVKLTGALFFVVDASSPWGVSVPQAAAFARTIVPRSQHVVSYHVVTRGSGYAAVRGDRPRAFARGDVLVVPHGDPYTIVGALDVRPQDDVGSALEFFAAMASGRLPFVVSEGGGRAPRSQFVCGFLGCDAQPFNPLLASLPRLMRVARSRDAREDLLDRLVELTLAEARTPRAGGDCIRLRLAELMFVEVLRRYLEAGDARSAGWLAGLRDPRVGRALALLHARPAETWTLETLAREVGVSRSVLAEHFARRVGCPPIHYLVRWRMQLAARELADGNAKVAAVGRAVGYASEAAFSRSFKKIAGASPAQWRERRGSRI